MNNTAPPRSVVSMKQDSWNRNLLHEGGLSFSSSRALAERQMQTDRQMQADRCRQTDADLETAPN